MSGVRGYEGDAPIADLDGYSLADAEAGFVEPVSSETDKRNGWRWWPVT
jgi:hypothetical protein